MNFGSIPPLRCFRRNSRRFAAGTPAVTFAPLTYDDEARLSDDLTHGALTIVALRLRVLKWVNCVGARHAGGIAAHLLTTDKARDAFDRPWHPCRLLPTWRSVRTTC